MRTASLLRHLIFLPLTIGLGAAGLSATACSAAPASDDSAQGASAPNIPDDVAVTASDETKKELGVTVWGASSDESDSTATFTGYDDRGNVKVRVRQTLAMASEDEHQFVVEVQADGKDARMKMESVVSKATGDDLKSGEEREIHLEVTENTLPTLPKATSALDRVEADFADLHDGTSLTGGGTKQLSLSPQGRAGGVLSNGKCTPLVKECGKKIYQFAKPLKGCAMLAVRVGIVVLCSVGGFLIADVPGAVIAGRRCFVKQAPKGAKDAADCAKNAKDIYENGGQRWEDVKQECAKAKEGCTENNKPATPAPSGSTPSNPPPPRDDGPLTSSIKL